MLECYLEQQQAVAVVLLSDEVRHNAHDIDILDPSDITEELVRLLCVMSLVLQSLSL